MPIQDAITAYQQAIANFEQKNQEAADLRNARLPELTSRLNANRLSMDSAQSAMRMRLATLITTLPSRPSNKQKRHTPIVFN